MKFTSVLAAAFVYFFIATQQLHAQNTFPSSGNVGIGTTSPAYALHVVSSGPLAFFQANTSSNAAITFANNTAQVNLGVGGAIPHGYLWSNSGSFFIGNDGGPAFFVKGMNSSSSIGINTTNPGFNLDVNGSLHANQIVVIDASGPNSQALWVRGTSSGGDANLTLQAGNSQAYWITGANGMLRIGNNGGTEPTTGIINIDMYGNMGVGGNPSNPASNYKLNVVGNVRANQVTVNTTGADFVFDTSYSLRPLRDLDRYIHTNHHLPDIAPAKQMQEEGVDVGNNQTLLLKKVEELTLYIIQQDKKMAEMQAQIDALKARPR